MIAKLRTHHRAHHFLRGLLASWQLGLGVLHARLGVLEVGLGALKARLGVLEAGLDVLEAGLSILEAGLGVLEAGLVFLEATQGVLEAGMGALEARLGVLERLWASWEHVLVRSNEILQGYRYQNGTYATWRRGGQSGRHGSRIERS